MRQYHQQRQRQQQQRQRRQQQHFALTTRWLQTGQGKPPNLSKSPVKFGVRGDPGRCTRKMLGKLGLLQRKFFTIFTVFPQPNKNITLEISKRLLQLKVTATTCQHFHGLV
jgi:hypothetical protein